MTKTTKPVKGKWIGARVDEGFNNQATKYIEQADITMGDLIRWGMREYMLAHPIQVPKLEPTIKPGE